MFPGLPPQAPGGWRMAWRRRCVLPRRRTRTWTSRGRSTAASATPLVQIYDGSWQTSSPGPRGWLRRAALHHCSSEPAAAALQDAWPPVLRTASPVLNKFDLRPALGQPSTSSPFLEAAPAVFRARLPQERLQLNPGLVCAVVPPQHDAEDQDARPSGQGRRRRSSRSASSSSCDRWGAGTPIPRARSPHASACIALVTRSWLRRGGRGCRTRTAPNRACGPANYPYRQICIGQAGREERPRKSTPQPRQRPRKLSQTAERRPGRPGTGSAN